MRSLLTATKPARPWFVTAWHELWGWLTPARCVGCGQPPAVLCDACRASVRPHATQVSAVRGVPVWAALEYEGVPAHLVRELKRNGSRFSVRLLSTAIAELARADPALAQVELVVVPPSRDAAFRMRGFHPIELVAHAAGLATVQPFELSRQVRDQRRLGVAERRANLDHAFELRLGWGHRLAGRRVLLLDDVVTTGATLTELARACASAGAEVRSVWALAATTRRDEWAAAPPAY